VGGNYKSSQLAFYNAEAGAQYTLGRIPVALSTNALHLDGTTTSEDFTVTAPIDFAFSLAPTATFKRVANTRNYYFQVTGRPAPTSSMSSTIEMVIRRGSILPYGIFGDLGVSLFPPGGGVYSYDSRITPSPTPADSTGEADVGTNGVFDARLNPHIDGDVALGDDGVGTEGTLSYTGTPTITGQAGEDMPRVNPDPLGASGGSVATAITSASITNDNAIAGIAANTINLNSGDPPMTLTAGTYYLESLMLNPGSTLNIDTSAGEVNIYLVGELQAQIGSTINFTGSSPGFTIYSNSTESIRFEHLGVFKGMVYAPFATVAMKNRVLPFLHPVAYGLIWARTVDMIVDFTGGSFYFDTALKDKFLSNNASIVSWKEFQN
jgi:hypothetical protein